MASLNAFAIAWSWGKVKGRAAKAGFSTQIYSPGLPPSRIFSGASTPSSRRSRSAAQARTTPATVLRSAIPRPAWPSSSAVITRFGPGEAPRRKEKFVAATGSA